MAEETLSPPQPDATETADTATTTTADTTTTAALAAAAAPTPLLDSHGMALGHTDDAGTFVPATADVSAGVAHLEAASAAAPTEGVPLQGETAPKPTIGRIVHAALDRGPDTGGCRPAIIVRVWNDEMINAQMFTDGLNDHMDYASGMAWKTSLHYYKPTAGQPTPGNTWHWSWED